MTHEEGEKTAGGRASAVHLGVDGTIWGGEESGVSIATRRLFQHYAAASPNFEFTVFLSRSTPAPPSLNPISENVRTVVQSTGRRGRRVAWQQLVLPGLARRHRIDLLYCPCYTAPLLSGVPAVVTIHDLIAWKKPEVCRLSNVLHFRALLKPSAARSRRITVPTETVKRDVIERLGVSEEKIHVVPWGADDEIRPVERPIAQAEVRRRFQVEPPFVLFAGSLEPKKNLEVLLSAAARIDASMVVAGPKNHAEGMRRLGENPSARHLGYVTAEELGLLYSAASVFAFPSHIEGFGLPVVEAMACGTPVVASEAEALLEVCGGAALHVPSRDVSGWAETLSRVLQDASLASDLARRGRERAELFKWERSAKLFGRVIEEALLD
jgi:glycosyltransferase involved in cell wall biosynthesis